MTMIAEYATLKAAPLCMVIQRVAALTSHSQTLLQPDNCQCESAASVCQVYLWKAFMSDVPATPAGVRRWCRRHWRVCGAS